MSILGFRVDAPFRATESNGGKKGGGGGEGKGKKQPVEETGNKTSPRDKRKEFSRSKAGNPVGR